MVVVAGAQLYKCGGQDGAFEVQMQLGLGKAADEGFHRGHDFKFSGWWFFPTLFAKNAKRIRHPARWRPSAKAVSALFRRVETGFFDLILLFCWGCGKSGGGVGVRGWVRLGPGLGFGLLRHACEGDLGGVEELAAVFRFDGAEEQTVAGASDEVADILIAGERGHGQAIGFGGTALGGVHVSGLLHGRRVNLEPNLGTKGDGGVFEGGIEGLQALGGGGLDGFDHEEFSGKGLTFTIRLCTGRG